MVAFICALVISLNSFWIFDDQSWVYVGKRMEYDVPRKMYADN